MVRVVDDARIGVEGRDRQVAGGLKKSPAIRDRGVPPDRSVNRRLVFTTWTTWFGPAATHGSGGWRLRRRSRGKDRPWKPGCAAGGFAVMVAWTGQGRCRPAGSGVEGSASPGPGAGAGRHVMPRRWRPDSAGRKCARRSSVARTRSSGEAMSPFRSSAERRGAGRASRCKVGPRRGTAQQDRRTARLPGGGTWNRPTWHALGRPSLLAGDRARRRREIGRVWTRSPEGWIARSGPRRSRRFATGPPRRRRPPRTRSAGSEAPARRWSYLLLPRQRPRRG